MPRDIDPSSERTITSPIGERIPLANGETIETPRPDVIARLQEADERVRYFATPDIAFAAEQHKGYTYYGAISEPLGRAIRDDFGDEHVMVRGTTAALEHSFPFWLDENTGEATVPCNDVLTILQTGSDDGSDRARVSVMGDDGTFNVETTEHLFTHWFGTYIELGNSPEGEQIFPVVIVYRPEAFVRKPGHGYNDLAGEPSERIAAMYITDRTTI